jgi:hypothetical protein
MAVIANITPNSGGFDGTAGREPVRRSSRFADGAGKRIVPVIALAISLALFFLAAPRFLAGAVTAPFDDTVRALGGDETVTNEDLRLALGSRLHAIGLVGDGRFYADLAALRFAEFERDPGFDCAPGPGYRRASCGIGARTVATVPLVASGACGDGA